MEIEIGNFLEIIEKDTSYLGLRNSDKAIEKLPSIIKNILSEVRDDLWIRKKPVWLPDLLNKLCITFSFSLLIKLIADNGFNLFKRLKFDPNIRNEHNYILYYAITWNKREFITYLIDNGAKIDNITTIENIEQIDPEIIYYLVTKGYIMNKNSYEYICKAYSKYPYELSVINTHYKSINYLINNES